MLNFQRWYLGVSVGLGLAASAHADAGFTNNLLQGSFRLNNANPAILSLLGAPGNEGVTNYYVTAYSGPPQNRSAATDSLTTSSRTSGNYQISVDSDATGIRYIVNPRLSLLSGRQYYFMHSVTSAPVVAFGPPVSVVSTECAGVLQIHFQDSSGNPLPVDGGLITAQALDGSGEISRLYSIPPGTSEQRFYVRGDAPVTVNIQINRGSNSYTDRLEYRLTTNLTVHCDQILDLPMTIPSAGSLAEATGRVDVLREFPISVDASDYFDYPDYTSVVAEYGPFGNHRYAPVPGVNFTQPSRGTFVLTNLVPSTLDPSSSGYVVGAHFFLRTNRAVEAFSTPALGWGSNPALAVHPSDRLSLSNLFVIDPGEISGKIRLQGPAESLGRPSLLRGVLHAGDYDSDHDGLPDAIGLYGIYYSAVGVSGIDRRAPGSSFTAAHGQAYGDFDGAFNPATSAYEGHYSLAVGGLNREPSLWQRDYLSVLVSSGTVTNDADYFYSQIAITDRTPKEQTVVPQQTNTADIAYCFSEVCIRFRSANQPFYNPEVRFSSGQFTGVDFQGRPASYSVYVDPAYGTPNSADKADTNGLLVLYLPQGSYQLTPYITPKGSTYAQIGGAPIEITVGCGQRICLEQCLQINLDSPTCSASPVATVAGTVRSCENKVQRISYSLDGGPQKTVCTGCGADPSFSFPIDLSSSPCQDHTLTITATSADGGVASVTTSLRYSEAKPVIECPSDITTQCANTNQVSVNFTVQAKGGCGDAVNVICQPPSGSLFPTGVTKVTCYAEDACGNRSADCGFRVDVRSQTLTIEKAVIVRWDCGILQWSENANGPWTDLPGAVSPYCVPSNQAHRFYRSRN